VRCIARRPEVLRSRVSRTTEVVAGDVLDPASLASALDGVDVAYYLIHSMGAGGAFEQQDRDGAENFARAAREAGVRLIVYLGGLGSGSDLSPHLASRQEVGQILRGSGVPTVEFRASIIVGSGSLSFEMIRSLVERLPVMTTPRWVGTIAQPIAVEDVIDYLLAAPDVDVGAGAVFEIGGADRVSYLDIMREYARQRGLRRLWIPVPVLSPRLSSLWLAFITPVYARVGRDLIEGVRNRTVVEDASALELFAIRPRGIREAIERALSFEDREYAATRWSDALSSRGPRRGYGGQTYGRRIVDSRSVQVACTPHDAFAPIARIGGRSGWYALNWAWRLRGFVDLLVGGVGMRRGRRDPVSLRAGDTLDFWRVEQIEPDRLLRLSAEMKLPGRAWLQFDVTGDEHGSTITQTAIFDPAGISGQLYWYVLYPAHVLVFAGMLRGIAGSAATR
jgi:uncharacterized protein YbjT (DUF2867 family)